MANGPTLRGHPRPAGTGGAGIELTARTQADIIVCMTKTTPRKTDLAKTLRGAIERSGLSMAAVAKLAGLPYAGIYRFVVYEKDLTLDSASRLCEALGLELRPAAAKGRK